MTRTAVVTGGASGIGRRTVECLLAQGWQVWSLDLAAHDAASLVTTAEARARFQAVRCDIADGQAVASAFETIAGDTGTLDALVCSAGVLATGALAEHTEQQVDRLLGVNVKGPWLCIRAALPRLRRNLDDPGRVVVVGSISGIRPKVGSGFYGASKAALHVLVGVFATELGPQGITVNAVAPGTVDTPMLGGLTPRPGADGYRVSGLSPLGRIATPTDIAEVVLFLLGPGASYVNGAVVPVDGGTRAAHQGP